MANLYSVYSEGSVSMIPDLDRMDIYSDDDKVCCFEVPGIHYTVMSETCEGDPSYVWRSDSVTVVNNHHIVEYIELTSTEVLLKNQNGESEWVNEKAAEIVGIDIGNRENVRVVKDYFVEINDLEKGEKKRGKVVFEEPSPMSEYDFSKHEKCYPPPADNVLASYT